MLSSNNYSAISARSSPKRHKSPLGYRFIITTKLLSKACRYFFLDQNYIPITTIHLHQTGSLWVFIACRSTESFAVLPLHVPSPIFIILENITLPTSIYSPFSTQISKISCIPVSRQISPYMSHTSSSIIHSVRSTSKGHEPQYSHNHSNDTLYQEISIYNHESHYSPKGINRKCK